MTAGTRKPDTGTPDPRKPAARPRFMLPQSGPAAIRAREAALDAAAARSKAARAGTPAPAPDASAALAEAQARIAVLQAALDEARAAEQLARDSATQALARLVEAQSARTEAERRLAEREAADEAAGREAAERAERAAAQRALAERIAAPVQPVSAAIEMPEAPTVADTARRDRRGTGPGEARRQPRPSASPAPVAKPTTKPTIPAVPVRSASPGAVEPPPPPVPSRHGRLDPKSPHAGLLVMAPPRPGDRGGRMFAELLDREAVRAAPREVEADDDGLRRNPTREDLRALACLWREADHFYAVLALRDGETLPLSGERMRRAAIGAGGGSIAGQVAEG